MCGIAGILSNRVDNRTGIIEKMLSRMSHRGPDSSGAWSDSNITLGHVRLSIIDTTDGGSQPMIDNSGRYVITFNGEIYNYRELKLKLKEYKFKSESDTEVILAAFSKWGKECVSYLRGQFAFAIWDCLEKELFIARDHIGEKPLYYYHQGNIFVFASEIRSLLSSGLLPNRISLIGIYDLLMYQSVISPNSIIENVFQLKSGHYALINNNNFECHQYFNICDIREDVTALPLEQIKKDVYNLLANAVEEQMISDVPLGAFLSGGIDSSAIVGLMASLKSNPVTTVSINFEESKYDESKFSSLIARKFNTQHIPIRLKSQEFLNYLDDYFNDMDVPSGDGANTWVVSKAAKEIGLTVALSGLGGDELFAGYESFKRFAFLSKNFWIWKLPIRVRKMVIPVFKLISQGNIQKIEQLLSQSKISLPELYGILRHTMSSDDANKLLDVRYYEDGVVRGHAGLSGLEYLSPLSQYSVFELMNYSQNVLLKDSDNMSMAHSLEIRAPFLNHELIRYVLSVPDKYKYPKTPKHLLIRSLGDLLPSEIINRPKMGFTFPWEIWLKNDLKGFCEKRILSLSQREFVRKEAIIDFWNRFIKGSKLITWPKIWLMVVLEEWIERNEVY